MCTLLLTFCLVLTSITPCGATFSDTTANAQAQISCDDELNKLLEEVKAYNEPALRVFLRLKIATRPWCEPSESFRPQMKQILAAALDDLQEHESEIPASYVNLFRGELNARVKSRKSESSPQPTGQPKAELRPEFEVALSLLGQENGIDRAVKIAERELAGGEDPGPIIVPFLRRLEKLNSAEVPRVLGAVVSAEEAHPGSISSDTLFTLKHLFVSQQTPQDLRRRYFAAVVSRAGETEPNPASAVNTYAILMDVLPSLEKQAPELYHTANARLPQLEAQVPKRALERMSVDRRVSRSSDPLGQLILEKEFVTDPSLKEELQVEAARLALEKGKIRMAIDLAAKLQPKDAGESLWRDQFIERAVGTAAGRGEMEVVRYGISEIESAAVRLSAWENVALQLQASKNSAGAREALNSALELLKEWEDGVDKAAALLDLAGTFMKVDSPRAADAAQAAVVVINNTPELSRKSDASGNARLGEVENVMKVAYRIVPTFQSLGKADKSSALDLAEQIRRQELRAVAKLGVYNGQPAADKGARVAASK